MIDKIVLLKNDFNLLNKDYALAMVSRLDLRYNPPRQFVEFWCGTYRFHPHRLAKINPDRILAILTKNYKLIIRTGRTTKQRFSNNSRYKISMWVA